MKINWPWSKSKDNWWMLVISLLVAQLAGVIGSLFTFPSISSWYLFLNKPFFSPPNWVFGPVWTTFYTFIGISAYLVWRKTQFSKKSLPFWRAYSIQLGLNTLWSIIFFGLENPLVAFIEIIILWYFIFRTIQEAAKIDSRTMYLLYPYLAWVSFASLLNLSIWLLN